MQLSVLLSEAQLRDLVILREHLLEHLDAYENQSFDFVCDKRGFWSIVVRPTQ